MSSFIETNEQALDYNSIHPKMKQSPKCFAFFIYYQRTQQQSPSTHLQKLAFTYKEQKNWNPDKQDIGKLIHLHFIDLENQQQVEQSFVDLKLQLIQSPKTKLIFYSTEYHLLTTLSKAKEFSLDLSQVPAALYSPDVHEDLAQHLGWKEPLLGDLSLKSSVEFEQNVKKWITSPGERIDMWTANISVDSQEGSIQRLDPSTNTFSSIYQKQLQEHFISHLAIGHHAQLAANYQTNRKEHSYPVINKCIFNFQSFKKFCCIGSPSLEASTGIVSIIFQDEKGLTQEITKHLVKQGNKRGVLSLLFSNIDKFMGMKLNGGRLNDSKLEMGVFESSKQCRLVGSSYGDLRVRLNAAEVFMSIGSTCLRLLHPRQLRISHWGKIKVLISKDTLQC